jgi:2-polyprenyl-3-methyl-5-hydroxy-6-metoxy-1,4-benzoquinol methylase
VARLLSWARAYKLLQVFVGSNQSHRRFVAEHVRPGPGARLLDVGCGPGHILRALPSGVRYVGVDASADYIAAARRDWGDRAEFHCARADELDLGGRRFDVVVAMGLLHHLDDRECAALIAFARSSLDPGGRLVTIDPAYAPGQARLARWLIGRDRGEHVRDTAEYRRLASSSFLDVEALTRDDLLRVPYTHAVLECSRDF